MGRPLKIAKAQAVLTITDTAASTDAVTVSQSLTTLGIIAGMPFVVASSVGGLSANTTYWILTVIDANNFTVSATDLSANITSTVVPLSDTTGQSVSASVGVVDAYFNNPVTNGGFPAASGNTYGVVGGNTSIVGPQVLTRVAIGVAGVGTIYGDTGNTNIYGSGTDFANTFSVGSAVQVSIPSGPGYSTDTNIGFVGTNTGYITVAVANTNATGNVIRTSGNAQTFFVGAPVTFSANTGGLVAGTVYFVDTIANASAFTVATTQYGTQKALVTGTDTATAKIDVAVLSANATANFAGASFVYANDEDGFILRQKGKQKYLVQGGTTGLVAQCYTANLANTALTPNTMNILATDAASGTAYVQSLSDYNSLEFTSTSGPIATGNIVLANADPVVATFNTAYAANTYGGQPYPIVTISNA
jgi:hypothetical protein